MKILFISPGSGPDYQCDMLFHGLRTVFGDSVVDANKLPYMYQTFNDGVNHLSTIYGRGFTLYGLLPDISIDRDDLLIKIKNKWFDIIIYGSIHRSQNFILDVLENYSSSDIFFIDGEDEPNKLFWPLIGRGHYLKRELSMPLKSVKPIQFAIPVSKISNKNIEKSRKIAHIDPRDTRTYIYNNEADYYADYQSSLFAFTTKKAGWDSLRHYEIMANNSIPIFIDLDQCPVTTMEYFPRMEIFMANTLLLNKGIDYFESMRGLEDWQKLQSQIKKFLVDNLTTASLANRILVLWKSSR
ncbi:hypothetical protein G6708_07025 [Polynucleobacter paneuropaeus]|nr:hypothetical protein [Polynucleobacter paneuropaeus]